jgi:hypothetical protein
MINKETFIDTINFLEVMVKKNKKDSETILFIKKIFTLLPLFFSNIEEARNEIEYYCFDTNFGKPSPDSEYITPGELYEKLI